MHRRWKSAIGTMFLLFALTALTTTAALADAGPHEKFVEQQESIEALSQLSGEDFEVGYINRIIPHHQGALEASQIMRDKAVNPELREEAVKAIEEQQMEIEQLTSYLSTTYGMEVEPDPAFVMEPEMLQQLRDATPEGTEIMFMLMMREHHQTAIEMGELVLATTDSQVLVEQATMMIESQRMQQDLFASYLNQWYGIQAPAVTGDAEAAMDYAMSVMMTPGMPNTGAGGTTIAEDSNQTSLLLGIAASVVVLVGATGLLLRQRIA